MNLKNDYQKIAESQGRIKGFFSFLGIVFHKLLEHIFIFICKSFFPVNKRIIVFKSTPDYSDNARALADFMVDNHYTDFYRIYFDVNNPIKYKEAYKNSPITFFSSKNKNGTYKLSNLKLIYTANYHFTTHEMIIRCYQGRKSQHFIRLWHGCSYKDRSSRDGHSKRNFDLALVPGPLFVKTKAYFWNVQEKYIIPKGYPRFDWLLERTSKAINLKQSFLNNENTKMVIWMPTFRVDKHQRFNDTENITAFPIVNRLEEWKSLNDLCKEKNILLTIKLHPFQKDYPIPFKELTNIKELSNADLENVDVPMYNFLAVCDALITDYSSVAFDFLVVDKPVAFTLDDYNEYKDNRGFIFDNPLEYMPGHHLYSYDDLAGFLSAIAKGEDEYRNERKRVKRIAITPSTHYCKDILDFLNI